MKELSPAEKLIITTAIVAFLAVAMIGLSSIPDYEVDESLPTPTPWFITPTPTPTITPEGE